MLFSCLNWTKMLEIERYSADSGCFSFVEVKTDV